MRILVYGAGVLGSLYAGLLKRSGADVTILARGQRYFDILRHGLLLENVATKEHLNVRLDVIDHLKPGDAYDWVLVLMRKNQVADMLPALAANCYTPNVVFMTNNAAGPDAYIRALGKQRVLLGFPGAGGIREIGLVRYVILSAKAQPVTLGELDGSFTPRLQELATLFRQAGIAVTISENIDAWLKSHVAVVAPIALGIYAAGGSNIRLANTRDALILVVRAIREAMQVLREMRIAIQPRRLRTLARLPEPALVAVLRGVVRQPLAAFTLSGHANAARDEMHTLSDEFYGLIRQTKVATPAFDRLLPYLDPTTPSIPEGSRLIRLNWREVVIRAAVEIAGGMVLVLMLARGLMPLVGRLTHHKPQRLSSQG